MEINLKYNKNKQSNMTIAYLNIPIDPSNNFNNHIYLANFVRIIHYMGTIFIIGAWYLPYDNCWYCNIIFVPSMFIQWHFTNTKCLLTIWEYNLRYGKPYSLKNKDNKTNPGFIEQIFTKITKIKSIGRVKTYLYRTMYIIPIISWGLCVCNIISFVND